MITPSGKTFKTLLGHFYFMSFVHGYSSQYLEKEKRYKTDIENSIEILKSGKIKVDDLISDTISQKDVKNFFASTCFERSSKKLNPENLKFRTIVKNI